MDSGGGDLVGVEVLLKLEVLLDIDKPRLDSLLSSYRQESLVLFRLGPLLVECCRLDAEFPRSLETCRFLEAVARRSIIKFN